MLGISSSTVVAIGGGIVALSYSSSMMIVEKIGVFSMGRVLWSG